MDASESVKPCEICEKANCAFEYKPNPFNDPIYIDKLPLAVDVVLPVYIKTPCL